MARAVLEGKRGFGTPTETGVRNGWRLAVGGRWRLVVGGWWLAVGGWRLVVGG